MSEILKKLESIAGRVNEVGQQIVDPDIIADMDRYVKLNKEYKELEEIVQVYKSFKNGFAIILINRMKEPEINLRQDFLFPEIKFKNNFKSIHPIHKEPIKIIIGKIYSLSPAPLTPKT